MPHTPVLLKEVIEILNPQPGEFFIDGTLGGAGHAVEIFKRILPGGKLLGIDLDENSLKIAQLKILTELKIKNKPSGDLLKAKTELRNNLILIQGNYADLPKILKQKKLGKADGLLLDLGLSSEQLEKSGRGFSFLKNEFLDMRYNQEVRSQKSKVKRLTAAEVINSFTEKDLADIFFKYGEERYSRQIARKIIEERKRGLIKNTFDLIQIIKKSVPKNYERSRIHPATRVFQALRIYVNDELGNLGKLLKNLSKIVKNKPPHQTTISAKGTKNDQSSLWCGGKGRVAIISYHSLEDRLVKNYFREMARQGKAKILTKKPIRPTIEEIQANPRSRSAKLRALSM